ncbi:MAG: hypothetical protein MUO40_10135, partial [Anaerolineaceae bacterium]|nr:hypothetical protein [Anaerolineaceae bacterium]
MKIEKKFTNDHQVKIVAEFESDLFEQYKHRAARQLSRKTKIAGFRPGKAPYAIIINQLGEIAVTQEAVDLLLEEEYPKVIDEAEIKPSGPGSLEEIKSENPPIFSFLIPLEPEVQLGEYKDLRKDYSPESLDEKRVNDYIYQLRRNSATIVPSEKVAEEGNLVYLTISATSSSIEEGEDQNLIEDQPQQVLIPTVSEEIDTEWPFKGFTRKVIGKNANAEFEVSHKYAKTYDDEKFQGKKVTFTVKVQSIKTLELPELNGEFLKSLGEYETADQFRKDLEERMILD